MRSMPPDEPRTAPASQMASGAAHVIVTRPARQAQGLCRMIEQAGGVAHLVPTLEIAPPGDPEAAARAVARLSSYDLAVFVSANAVHSVCTLLDGRPWPERTRIAVVGRASADALARHGLPADIVPGRSFDSEGLLAEDALRDAHGLRVIVFRGDGGRELLADTLRERGAQVDCVEVYRRRLPVEAAASLARIAEGAGADAIMVTSNQGLLNLHAAAGDRLHDWLLSRQLVVIAQRTADLASELGFHHHARIAAEASDAGLMEALRDWVATRSSGGTWDG